MSYDISLVCKCCGQTLHAPENFSVPNGGTYAVGGSSELWLNVTYNYSKHYGAMGPKGIREIYGLTGTESLPVLERGIAALSDERSDDYWEATQGNAKQALLGLQAMALARPGGVWKGD